MSRPDDPPELRGYFARGGTCRPPSYRRGGFSPLFDGPFAGWVACELDDAGTAPRAPRAWPICAVCSPARCAAAEGRPISPTDGGERGRCAWAITAPGTVVVGAAGRPIGRLAEAVWCRLGAS